MKNSKICIIGNGLSGLTLANVLKNLNIDIDLYYSNKNSKNIQDKRTTAISHSNYNFLNKIIGGLKPNIFWPNKKINLFFEYDGKFNNFLNFDDKKNILYVFENLKFKSLLTKLLKDKKVNFISKNIKTINDLKEKYDLKILCLGNNSNLYESLTNNRSINKDYKEISVVGYVKHNEDCINAKQYFLDEGPFAILPFNQKEFSFVWSIEKKFFLNNKNKLEKLILEKLKIFLNTKKNLSICNVQNFPIKLDLKVNYYKKNLLILGEGLHSVHPLAGQGFNLVIRDIKKLYEIIDYNLKLGLDLKNSSVLQKFYEQRKPENILLGMGIDFTHTFFKKNKYINPLKNLLLKNIGNNEKIKSFSRFVADKGIYN